ncbi:MAG: glycosyltransferase family 2 protein [Candidatus Uhrbacteria bacterium]|nr:glycosyltransferase family 2 protein [Candidatus Uhrbacteria bacterium]
MLTWNDRKYLPDLFESLENQTYKNFLLRILDNGSTDETVEYIQQYHPHTLVSRNLKNNGFAGGFNQLFRFTFDRLTKDDEKNTFILIMNSDMILAPNCLEELVGALEANPKLGAVQPKLYRAFGERMGDEVLQDTIKSDVIDTTGLRLHKNWRMTDRGAGEIDKGQYDTATDIFGPSGTMALYRLEALNDAMLEGTVFDSDFFAYKEDCDLAWRMRKLGWESRFVPAAIGYHYRGMYGAEKQSLLSRIKNRRGQRPFTAALSTRNQLFTLIKNLTILSLILSIVRVAFNEGIRVFYGILFESETRRRIFGMSSYLPKMLKRRKLIRQGAKVPEKAIRQYVGK